MSRVLAASQPARHLARDACLDIRDLGGYATAGGQTNWRAFSYLDTRYGGMRGYPHECGVADGDIERIRARLRA